MLEFASAGGRPQHLRPLSFAGVLVVRTIVVTTVTIPKLDEPATLRGRFVMLVDGSHTDDPQTTNNGSALTKESELRRLSARQGVEKHTHVRTFDHEEQHDTSDDVILKI